MSDQYAVIGTWNHIETDMGLTLCSYEPQDGTFERLHYYDPQIKTGCQVFDPEKNILYVVDEREGRPGEDGGGGYIRSYAFHAETAELEFLNEKCVLMGNPAYIALDPKGEYCLVACHSGRGRATKVVYDGAGKWTSGVVYDDAGVVLFALESDGRIGDICDVSLHGGLAINKRQVISHVHSIKASPDGEIYFACDKGLDRIFSYKISRERKRLIPMIQTETELGMAPRYSTFHPTLPVWYENNESGNRLFAFYYDEKTGALEKFSEAELYEKGQNGMPSDLILHPSARYLYAAVRNINEISVIDVDQKSGALTMREKIQTPGGARNLMISPDGRFLFATIPELNLLVKYSVAEDGSLADTGYRFEVTSAANLCFI